MPQESLKERLELGAIILNLIDRLRQERQDPHVGLGIERLVIGRELTELEENLKVSPPPKL